MQLVVEQSPKNKLDKDRPYRESKSTSDGLVGLVNLGNTCFMNSALQCLGHTVILVRYFLSGEYQKDLNFKNPLGMQGKLAESFYLFLKEIWVSRPLKNSGKLTPIVPKNLKSIITKYAPQFHGYEQHDSQEFIAFLLDGLHEDLNRVKNKPKYQVGVTEESKKTDEELAEELWRQHKLRNDSFIVDSFQGQYKSRVQCVQCGHISVTFDPFMYLSVSIPKVLRENYGHITLMPSVNSVRVRGIKFPVNFRSNTKVSRNIKWKIGEEIMDHLKNLSLSHDSKFNDIRDLCDEVSTWKLEECIGNFIILRGVFSESFDFTRLWRDIEKDLQVTVGKKFSTSSKYLGGREILVMALGNSEICRILEKDPLFQISKKINGRNLKEVRNHKKIRKIIKPEKSSEPFILDLESLKSIPETLSCSNNLLLIR